MFQRDKHFKGIVLFFPFQQPLSMKLPISNNLPYRCLFVAPILATVAVLTTAFQMFNVCKINTFIQCLYCHLG